MITVQIIEHNPLATRYLRRLFSHISSFRLTFSSDFSVPLRDRHHTVLVIDRGSLPHDLFYRFQRTESNTTNVIVVDVELTASQVCELLITGIRGFVPYSKVDQTLARAIKSVAAGHLWVEAQILELLAHELVGQMRSSSQKQQTFSSRQRMVIDLLQGRLSNKEIGSALGISERTVKFHLANIYSKLGINDRHSVVELIRIPPIPPSQNVLPPIEVKDISSQSCKGAIAIPRAR